MFLSKTCGSSHFLTIAFDTLCFGHKNGLIWRIPKWSGNLRNSQKWGRKDTIFEARFSALWQGNFKDDQNSDFLDHPNGQNHIDGSQWDGLGPLPWKIWVLGVRPILSLPTSLKCILNILVKKNSPVAFLLMMHFKEVGRLKMGRTPKTQIFHVSGPNPSHWDPSIWFWPLGWSKKSKFWSSLKLPCYRAENLASKIVS